MKIEGVFSSESLHKYPVVLEPLASVSITYGNILDDETKLRLSTMPCFDEVMQCFIAARTPVAIKSLQLDICLSLFYNPYFSEFYEYIKADGSIKSIFGARKIKYMISRMLNYLSDDIYYEMIVTRNGIDDKTRDYYIKNDIWQKSKELLKLLS